MTLLHCSLARLALLALLCASTSAFAACGPESAVEPRAVSIDAPAVLIAVHPSSNFDARYATKRGVDEAVAFARATKTPIVALADDSEPARYFIDACAPRHWVRSAGGEIDFALEGNDVYFVGGHLEICLARAMNDVLLRWGKAAPVPRRTMTLVMDAIYSNGKLIETSDPYHARFAEFLAAITYGRPGGEHWSKVTLLETIGAIGERNEIAYLERTLPRWARTLPANYRVELSVSGLPPKVLRPGTGARPPVVAFRFVESADLLIDHGFGSTALELAAASAPGPHP